MGTVIQWADWAAAQEAIRQTSQAVSGMSPAEAEAALNWSKTSLKDGTFRYVHNASSAAGGSNVVQFPGTDASGAFNSYVGDGGLTGSGGAAVSNPATSSQSNLTMLKGAGATTGIGALLSMNLPTAAAAIAPLAGVALGAGLYELAPDFWEKISRALLPFCYDDTDLLPVVADENGNTYFPQGAVDALKALFKENIETAATSDISDSKYFSMPFYYGIGTEGFTYFTDSSRMRGFESSEIVHYGYFKTSDNNIQSVFAAKVPFNIEVFFLEKGEKKQKHNEESREVSYLGKNFYYYSFYIRELVVEQIIKENNYSSEPGIFASKVASYIMLYGNEVSNYPDGVSKWEGASYPSTASGIEVITNIDEENVTTQPYYPISTPIGDPGTSVNPGDTPDITVNPNPGPAIDPWITPSPAPGTYPIEVPPSNPAPLPDPVPNPNPNLNPEADPSQEPAPQPDPAEQSPKPGDSGTSPKPQVPIIPTLPSAATGLLHVYNPTQAQLDSFGSWLWTTFSGDLIDTLSKLFNDPMDAVIGLHELYTSPAVSGQATIRAGYLDSGVSSNIVGSRYTSINCGSVVVPEFYSNYLDYSPYTKCYIYLPFVGIVPVLADDIIGNAVNITYHVDSYTGCCIAVVTVAREGYSSTVYQFEGNCGVEIPITSGYQSTLVGAMLGIAGTAISGSPHVGLAASNLGRANLGKNDASHSGSFGASYGAMGAKIPYIIVKRPTQKSVVNYNEDYGFPAHTRVTIGACSGYLRAREVHVISPTATDEEKARIEELLKGGVFVK